MKYSHWAAAAAVATAYTLSAQTAMEVATPETPAICVIAPPEEPPLSPTVIKGLAWLIAAQSEDGGFGQDGAQPRDGVRLETSGRDVANTSLAALAMLRSGVPLSDGEHSEPLMRAIEFVLSKVEAAPDEGLAITDVKGTQVQRKLGPYVDTFLASMLLGELRGQMPDEASERRVVDALDKVVDKIETNQQKDGSWDSGGGWAPVISTSLASRGLATASRNGADVDAAVLARVDEYSLEQFDEKEGKFEVGKGDAGIALYKVAQVMEQVSRKPGSNETVLGEAADLLESRTFQDGFGSMGGEEFISYMNISDSLIRTGGEAWEKWNADIVDRLAKLQNQDGSWAGHHCITGRVACTAAAVLTLTAERTSPQ